MENCFILMILTTGNAFVLWRRNRVSKRKRELRSFRTASILVFYAQNESCMWRKAGCRSAVYDKSCKDDKINFAKQNSWQSVCSSMFRLPSKNVANLKSFRISLLFSFLQRFRHFNKIYIARIKRIFAMQKACSQFWRVSCGKKLRLSWLSLEYRHHGWTTFYKKSNFELF